MPKAQPILPIGCTPACAASTNARPLYTFDARAAKVDDVRLLTP
jgi:hypothetical protein